MKVKLTQLSLADARCVYQLLAESDKPRTAVRGECGLQLLKELINKYGVQQVVEMSLRKRDAIELLEIIWEGSTERLDDDEIQRMISLFDMIAPQISPEHRPDVT